MTPYRFRFSTKPRVRVLWGLYGPVYVFTPPGASEPAIWAARGPWRGAEPKLWEVARRGWMHETDLAGCCRAFLAEMELAACGRAPHL